MILFGHPTGNPNSHNAALAHYEAGRLEAFCVPWMPTSRELGILRHVPMISPYAARLERRRFAPLCDAPLIEDRLEEWLRMLRRVTGGGPEERRLAFEANDWTMRTMRRECRRPSVSALHSYEDCSLWQFQEAKRLGKMCIYDMPIGYHPAWEQTYAVLMRRYADWLPARDDPSGRHERSVQKQREMELADLVLAPSPFVRETILRFIDKEVRIAPYGVDSHLWVPPERVEARETLTFIYAGQMSVRKGVPLLVEAWEAAALKHARLDLVGPWQLARAKRTCLPSGVTWTGPLSRGELVKRYQAADVFVLPTFFEGRALVVGEALSCGLPVVTTDASGAADLVDDSCGRLIRVGELDELVAALRFFTQSRACLPAMSAQARARATKCTWETYRRCVASAVTQLN